MQIDGCESKYKDKIEEDWINNLALHSGGKQTNQ